MNAAGERRYREQRKKEINDQMALKKQAKEEMDLAKKKLDMANEKELISWQKAQDAHASYIDSSNKDKSEANVTKQKRILEKKQKIMIDNENKATIRLQEYNDACNRFNTLNERR